MVDLYDRAQEREQEDRERAIQNQLLKGRETETPDEDEETGIRYCLDCRHEIDPRRMAFRPESVRCVECQNFKDKRTKR